jgi:hypothetical protein
VRITRRALERKSVAGAKGGSIPPLDLRQGTASPLPETSGALDHDEGMPKSRFGVTVTKRRRVMSGHTLENCSGKQAGEVSLRAKTR